MFEGVKLCGTTEFTRSAQLDYFLGIAISSGVVFFGYFLLDKQKKVSRRPAIKTKKKTNSMGDETLLN